MKGDTVLDYAEFQLTPPRTRCELFVSADGVTEKLASGFLKPFLTHLRAAEEQIAKGFHAIRLERPRLAKQHHERIWFTKGTLERFVRFVSTPEVLERVKTIEDELAQLEQVRSIQASSLLETEDGYLGASSIFSRVGGKTVKGLDNERNGSSNIPRRYPYDGVSSGAEASKRDLLRAMDVRLLALQQEQNTAFSRADAAGFDRNNMTDLIAFSEFFGAERLRAACIQFLTLSRKRHGAPLPETVELDSSATSSGSDMSLSSASGADITGETEVSSFAKPIPSQDTRFDGQKGSGEPKSLRTTDLKDVRIKLLDRDTKTEPNSLNRANGGTEARKRWGPPENLRQRSGVIQDEAPVVSVFDTSRGVLQNENSDGHKCRGSRLDESGVSRPQNFEMNSEGVYRLYTNDRGNRHSIPTLQTTRANLAEKSTERINKLETRPTLKDQALSSPTKGSQSVNYNSDIDPEGGTNLENLQSKLIDVPFNTSRDNSAHRQQERTAVQAQGDSLSEVARESSKEISSASPEIYRAESQTNGTMYDTSNWQETKQSMNLSQYNFEDLSPESYSRTQADSSRVGPQRPSSPKRRSASPHRRVQIGRSGARRSGSVVIRSINYFSSQDRSNKDKSSTNESSSSDNEEPAKDNNEDQPAPVPIPSPAPARRLSVQAAISLFESKQHKDSIEVPLKKRPAKRESCGGSLEGANSSSSGIVKPRRWSERYDKEVSSGSHNEKFSDKQENKAAGEVLYQDHAHFGLADSSTIAMNVGRNEASLENLGRPLSEHTHKRDTLKSSIDSSTTKFWQPTTKLAAGSRSAEPEAEVQKQIPSYQQQVVSNNSDIALEGERRKQFKLQLEKSLSRESIKRDPITMEDPAKPESGTVEASVSEKAKLSEREFSKRTDSGPSCATSTVTTVHKDGERFHIGVFDDTRQCPPAPDSSVVTTLTSNTETKDLPNHRSRTLNSCETDAYPVEEGQALRTKEERTKAKACEVFREPDSGGHQGPGRESLGSSVIAPFDFDMGALVKMVDHHIVEDGGQQGRFYEQYRKLRDAKMMEEHTSKKAEREAKLRCMEETLEKRKAEMDARTARLSKKNNEVQARTAKMQALKADVAARKKEQEDERDKEQETNQGLSSLLNREQKQSNASPPSPSCTPLGTKERVCTPKFHLVKKVAPAPQKATTTPRSSTRLANSVSPRSTPRSSTGATPIQRGSAVSSVADNPLARSVPCFADLRKENTKPSPGRSSGSTRLNLKNGGGRPRVVNEAALLEPNANVWVNGTSRNGAVKDEKKRRSTITRKSCATAADFKSLSFPGDEGVLAPLKGQREVAMDPAIYSKLRRSAVAPIQEAKPFLRKGRGIGPGAGPGVMKLKASVVEEAPGTATEIADAKDGENQTGEESLEAANPTDVSVVENPPEMEDADGLNAITTSHSADEASFSMFEEQEKSEITTGDPLPEDLFENERACHTISFPIDFETQKRYANTFGAELDSNPQSFVQALAPKQEDSVPLSQLLVEGAAEYLQGESGAADSPSFRASSLPREITAPPFSPAAASPSIAMRPGAVSDYFSPSSAVATESPLGSPASWNSSQIQYASEAEIARAQKKWVGAHKPVFIVPPKEPARGFKRLLNFARKSRTPEIVTIDGISPATTSEGDDDAEDPRDVRNRSADDLLRRARLQERSLKEFGHVVVTRERYHSQEQGLMQSVRSSIPAPPANFRLRDDHLSGGTMLKAPRSFFSLSSFRNRSSEAKSR